jgi:hypothetical protein
LLPGHQNTTAGSTRPREAPQLAAPPREAEGLDISADLEPVTVESVGYDFDDHPTVFVGRVVLDDLQVLQLRKLGWRVRALLGSRR